MPPKIGQNATIALLCDCNFAAFLLQYVSYRLVVDVFDFAAKESVGAFLNSDVCDGLVKEWPVLEGQVSKL